MGLPTWTRVLTLIKHCIGMTTQNLIHDYHPRFLSAYVEVSFTESHIALFPLPKSSLMLCISCSNLEFYVIVPLIPVPKSAFVVDHWPHFSVERIVSYSSFGDGCLPSDPHLFC